jgi:hypothetical protein
MTTTHTVGEQNISGYVNLTVEGTTGFPASGWLKIGASLYSYNGKSSYQLLQVTGPQWQFDSGTEVTLYRSALAPPVIVGEFRNEGVGSVATLDVTGAVGDVVGLCLVVPERSITYLTHQSPPTRYWTQSVGGWTHASGTNPVRGYHSWYRFMTDKTQTFQWTFDQSFAWEFAGATFQLAEDPGHLAGSVANSSATDGTIAFGYNQLVNFPPESVMVDVLGGKSSGSTITAPDPDPGLYTSFRPYGEFPMWAGGGGGTPAYPADLRPYYNSVASVQAGDLLLLQAWSATGGSTPLLAGWTSLFTASDPQCRLSYRVWQEGDPTTIAGAGDLFYFYIFRGVSQSSPIEAFSSSGSVGATDDSLWVALFFLTTVSTSYYIDSPSGRSGNPWGFAERAGINSYGTNKMGLADQPVEAGTYNQLVWTWGNGNPMSSLGTFAQAAVMLRPATPPSAHGTLKKTPAFFTRTEPGGLWTPYSYTSSDRGTWFVSQSILSAPPPEEAYGDFLSAANATIAIAVAGLENYHGGSPQDGTLREEWLALYPEDARPFLAAFPDSPVPENVSSIIYLNDNGDTVAVHPYSRGRDTWGYGPVFSPDGSTLVVSGWFSDTDFYCFGLDGTALWQTSNYGVDTPPCFSADGTVLYAFSTWGPENTLLTIDAATGDLLDSKALSDQGQWPPWNPRFMPDGTHLIGAVYDNDEPIGIYTIEIATGAYEPWLLWDDVVGDLPFPVSSGEWGLDVHPGGEGFVVAVRGNSSRRSFETMLIEVGWDKSIQNTYRMGDWAFTSGFPPGMIELCYSRDGNYIYTTDDLGWLVMRFTRGPGSVGGELPFMNLQYVSRADWEAEGFPLDLGDFSETDVRAAWFPGTTGVDTRIPSVARPSNAISHSVVGVRGRW